MRHFDRKVSYSLLEGNTSRDSTTRSNMLNAISIAQDAIDDFVDAVELYAEDGDEWAAENLEVTTAHVFDAVPAVALLVTLTT